jgi:GLPGLI family protein
MRNFWIYTGLFLSFHWVWSQNIPIYQITYEQLYHGKVLENQNLISIQSDADQLWIGNENQLLNKNWSYPQEFKTYNYRNQHISQFAQLSENKILLQLDSTSIANQKFEIKKETKKILGYNCQKAVTVINSNTIEVWFVSDSKIKGAPSTLGLNLGLVLEQTRNGNFTILAKSIVKLKQKPSHLSPESSKVVITNGLDYRDALWKSRFITLPVFTQELVRFSDQAKSDDTIKRFANGTIICRKVTFPKIEAGNQIFIELKEQSNGDAYDRTGSVFMITENLEDNFWIGLTQGAQEMPIYTNAMGNQYQGIHRTTTFEPALELMRFFTPFGIKQYNHINLKDKNWHDIVSYRQDISELHSQMSEKELWIGVFIGNYDGGGHKVDLEITVHPGEKRPFMFDQALPLFNTTNLMEMAGQNYGTLFEDEKGLLFEFDLETPLKNAHLRYVVTGHGGWENGDEFVPKTHEIILNHQMIQKLIPWRSDCGSYRLYNPASGNFNNGLSSSDYSRSNWCPGMVTFPIMIPLGDLNAGKHQIQIKIPQGKPEGGSFSAWNISGVLLGN